MHKIYEKRFTKQFIKIKINLCITKYYAMKMYGGVEVQLHASLISALDGSGQLQAPTALPLGKLTRYPIHRRLLTMPIFVI
jgi:hypothetical protein